MIELRNHQVKALVKLRNGSILCGGVGSGKSIVSIAYFWSKVCNGSIRPFKAPTHYRSLYIITTARKRDSLEWEGDLAKFGLSKHSHDITIDSWNNISKYKRVTGAFFIFDEQRIVGNGAWVKNFLAIAKKNQWILLSATPGDTWMDYVPVFLANGFYKNRTDFITRHVVYSRFSKYPKVDRYIETKRLERLRAQILVDMPFERHTERHRLNIPVEYDKPWYDEVAKKRFNPFKDEPCQDAGVLWGVLRHITNADASRMIQVQDLLQRHDRLIIFYNFDYELEALRTITGRTVAEWNGHKHEPVPDDKKWAYLVNYAAGAEAWNCITTNAICFYSLNYSYRVMEQAEGRIDRLNTPFEDLYYYRLISASPVDKAIGTAIKTKKKFNELPVAEAVWKENS